MIKIINYVDCVSNAFLKTIEHLENLPIDREKNKIIVTLNSEFKILLDYFLETTIKSETIPGYKNILLNTAVPFNNWRMKKFRINKDDDEIYTEIKYDLIDNSIHYPDKFELESFFNTWYKKYKNYKIEKFENKIDKNNEIDIYDFNYALSNIVAFDYRINKNPSYFTINDINIKLFYHNCDNFPDYLTNYIEKYLNKIGILI